VPLFVPLGLFVYGRLQKRQSFIRVSGAVLLAVLVGFFVSTCIKVFTGRVSPPHHGPFDADISSAFQFGFMEHQIMGGWPSSHATVIFALVACLCAFFPQKRWLPVVSYAMAFFIGIGVTFGFHWFSEFLMGALLGYVLGRSVYLTGR
jgi:membrane-associated phospholipid phosphatase